MESMQDFVFITGTMHMIYHLHGWLKHGRDIKMQLLADIIRQQWL